MTEAVLDRALRRVAAHGLLGTRLEALYEPLPDGDFARLVHRAVTHRLGGLALFSAVDGALPVTDAQFEHLESAHIAAMCTCLAIEHGLLELADALTGTGLDVRVIKGPAAAHLDYPSPELRAFGDLDVLVRSEQIELAKTVIESLGYVRPTPEPRPGFDRRFGKGITYVANSGHSIDLHRTFVMGPLGLTVHLDDLWADTPDTFPLADRLVSSVLPAHRLLVAAYNAVAGDAAPRLGTLRDIAQLAFSGEVDTRHIVDTARRWRGELVLARAVTSTWAALELADVTSLSAWAHRFDPEPEDERTLRLYQNASTGYARLAWASVRVIPGAAARWSFLNALAFPSNGRLGPHQLTLRERLTRARRGLARE